MRSPIDPRPDTFVPAFPRGMLRNLAIDMAMPWIAVQLLTRFWGFSIVPAIAIAAVFPAASIMIGALRRRRLDFIGALVLVTLAGRRGPVARHARRPLRADAGRAGRDTVCASRCLVSLPARRPLMFFFARQFTAGDDPAKIAAWNARVDIAGFRRAMRVLTLVWGLAFLAKAALWTASALLLSPTAALLSGPAIGLGAFAALMAWTIAYARRGAARLAAAEARR